MEIKKLPRCKRDMFIERETDRWYARCLQCGNQLHLPSNDHAYLDRARKTEKALIK